MTSDLGCPYKGLASYEDSELDVRFFFGRERERDIICANLMASKLTVLYGDTGVGKSSVLRAGVAHSLRARGDALDVVVFDAWKDDPAAGLTAALSEAAGVEPRDTLADTLEACSAKLDGDVYVILDGVEEYFLYHEGERGPGTFFSELPDAIKRPGLRASFLLAIREDALAKLDRFKAGIPNLFGNYLRLPHLDREAAKSAILRPVDRYNELVDASERMAVDTDLADAVLDEVAAGRVDLGQAGRGVVPGASVDDRIEAPYLQLVMRRLWEAEEAAGSHMLRTSTLEALGGAEEIVRAHLARALEPLTGEQKDIAAAVFNHLVTPSGAKIAHAVPDLARYADVSETELEPVLRTLARERILRPAAADGGARRYEIYHDVLGDAVLAWRTGHETEREVVAERRAAASRHRRLLTALAAGGVLVAVMVGVTAYALTQRSEAQSQARTAQARQLDSASFSQLTIDPELSLVLASQAARLAPGPDTEEALRTAYIFSRERMTLPADGPVSAASYSPYGKHVLVAGEAGTARVYDAETGKLALSVKHGAPLLDAAFSSDGRRFVTAGQDGTARVWESMTGRRISTLRHGAPVRAAAFDHTGNLVVTVGGKRARIWRTEGGSISTIRWLGQVTDAFFSPRGRLLAVVGNESVLRLYDGSTGRPVRTLDQGGRVINAEFGPGGGLIVTAGANDSARVWSVGRGRLLHKLTGHRGSVLDASFSPRGSRIATVSADGTGRIWDASTGTLVASIGGHKGIVDAVAFSPDGNFVVTGSTDRTARVSKADNGDGRALLAGHDDSVHTVAFNTTGTRVLTASDDGTARIWDPAIQPHLDLVRRTGGPLVEAEYLGDGDRILVAGPGRQALVIRAADGRVVEAIPTRGSATAVAASPDGKRIATAGGRVLTLRREGGPSEQLVHPDKVTSVAFSPDGSRVVTGGRRGKARIWSTDGRQLLELSGHSGEITDVAFSQDGRRVATASTDKTARIWDASTGRMLRRLAGHTDDVTSVAFSPDGQLVLTASRDHDARLWNAHTGARTQLLRAHFGQVAGASFSPDGRWVLTAGPSAVLLWRPGIAEPILPYGFGGHEAPLASAVFDPTGRFVLTTSADGTVRRAACAVCGDLEDMIELSRAQLTGSVRTLTDEEREKYGIG